MLAIVLLLVPIVSRAGGSPEGTACRSVHLRYAGPEGIAFYNEVTVEQSARGTYFEACGFDKGYFGIQELGDGKKVVLFSVWDPGEQNDPKSVASDRQVKVIAHGEGIRVSDSAARELAKSSLDYDWKIGQDLPLPDQGDDRRRSHHLCRLLSARRRDGMEAHGDLLPLSAARGCGTITRLSRTSAGTGFRPPRFVVPGLGMGGCRRRIINGWR